MTIITPDEAVKLAANVVRLYDRFGPKAVFRSDEAYPLARYVLSRPREERWQDISTAPKTGDDLLEKCVLAYCKEDHPNDRFKVVWWEPKIKGGVWWSDADIECTPTHWQPLPLAPTAASPVPEGMEDVLEDLTNGLRIAAERFREYEKLHLAKSPPDTAKAQSNGDMATRLEWILGRPRPPASPAPGGVTMDIVQDLVSDWATTLPAKVHAGLTGQHLSMLRKTIIDRLGAAGQK